MASFQVESKDIQQFGLSAAVLLGYIRSRMDQQGRLLAEQQSLADELDIQPLATVRELVAQQLISVQWKGSAIHFTLNPQISKNNELSKTPVPEFPPKGWSVQPRSKQILKEKYQISDLLLATLEESFHSTSHHKDENQSWESRFIAYAINADKQYQHLKTRGQGARLHEISSSWKPSDKAMQYLALENAIPKDYLATRALPEFILYWKEREPQSSQAWNKLFVGWAIENFERWGKMHAV